MKKYILVSTQLEGSIEFFYNERGCLNKYINNSTWDNNQQDFLCQCFPTTLSRLEELKAALKNGKIIEEKIKITFEDFYEKYGYKVGKKEAENKWSRMTHPNRYLAYMHIDAYKYGVKLKGIAMKYPATYLSSETWND